MALPSRLVLGISRCCGTVKLDGPDEESLWLANRGAALEVIPDVTGHAVPVPYSLKVRKRRHRGCVLFGVGIPATGDSPRQSPDEVDLRHVPGIAEFVH